MDGPPDDDGPRDYGWARRPLHASTRNPFKDGVRENWPELPEMSFGSGEEEAEEGESDEEEEEEEEGNDGGAPLLGEALPGGLPQNVINFSLLTLAEMQPDVFSYHSSQDDSLHGTPRAPPAGGATPPLHHTPLPDVSAIAASPAPPQHRPPMYPPATPPHAAAAAPDPKDMVTPCNKPPSSAGGAAHYTPSKHVLTPAESPIRHLPGGEHPVLNSPFISRREVAGMAPPEEDEEEGRPPLAPLGSGLAFPTQGLSGASYCSSDRERRPFNTSGANTSGVSGSSAGDYYAHSARGASGDGWLVSAGEGLPAAPRPCSTSQELDFSTDLSETPPPLAAAGMPGMAADDFELLLQKKDALLDLFTQFCQVLVAMKRRQHDEHAAGAAPSPAAAGDKGRPSTLSTPPVSVSDFTSLDPRAEPNKTSASTCSVGTQAPLPARRPARSQSVQSVATQAGPGAVPQGFRARLEAGFDPSASSSVGRGSLRSTARSFSPTPIGGRGGGDATGAALDDIVLWAKARRAAGHPRYLTAAPPVYPSLVSAAAKCSVPSYSLIRTRYLAMMDAPWMY
eukprot:TRINITY_DN9375_c1_g1_i2.p1 TRINITY_DN9375_c1_g1~~TRINITY_DN9375_c1_g1_i2.p1  ORF type:complete len:566 (+),score=211.50 TRINITY_DN9375_c1_g1_i2:56-1753(+)